MSGGPPHHPHNAAWNHLQQYLLQVPNFFPRQPQHAHMSSGEHPMMHQPTWHTPTTEPLKTPHSHIINLEQMLSERQFQRQAAPGVDLSLTRSAAINGDLPAAPISLSVRDTNKINSLAASALERQGELTKAASPKAASPPTPAAGKTKSPTPDKQLSPKIKKVKRVDSILERLNPQLADSDAISVNAAPAHDENSNSSSILNVPTPRDEDVVSPYSNEDSLDSNKSRRKRKPSKTMKVTKEAEAPTPTQSPSPSLSMQPDVPLPQIGQIDAERKCTETPLEEQDHPERRKTSSPRQGRESPRKTRRKNSSDDETIDKIAAMVGNLVGGLGGLGEDPDGVPPSIDGEVVAPAPAQAPMPTMVTLAQKKDFVAVEDKLEEMFAGLEDKTDELSTSGALDDSSISDILNLTASTSAALEVSSTSCFDGRKKPMRKKRKLKVKQLNEKGKSKGGRSLKNMKNESPKSKKMNGKAKFETKDVYAYDSGSNASSSKSRGPFVHISGPRDSPLSVSVINAPANDEEKAAKAKPKFHDDTDFRRSKGLHCSTLSHKYDAQTKDASWLCAFCKRGPYTAEFADNDAHYTPGDLFGPYVITAACGEYSRRLSDPYDKAFKSNKIARCLDAAAAATKPGKRGPKRKVSLAAEPTLDAHPSELGIARLEDATFEVWAHEDCIVWSPGIYLVGPKMVGLEEAVWTASNVACARCAHKGANVCCMKRGCTSVMHLGCAYIARWRLDDEHYKAFCAEHARRPTE